jgi:acetolactate synthase-1/2/3 large subunit
MTTAQATVASLRLHGVDTVYCVPGVQNDHLMDAFQSVRGDIRVIHTRHEQGAAYMALGAAMASGSPAVYCVVPGPGILNTTGALCTAYACNAPVLALTGQIPSASIGRNLGILHEIPDQLGILRSLTKWSERIRTPSEGATRVTEAFAQMTCGRPRPVALECPLDVWAQIGPVELGGAPGSRPSPEIDPELIARSVAILAGASRPVIVVGSGAQHASAQVRKIAERLQAPVIAHRMGRGVLDSRHPLSATAPMGNRLWQDADVVLAVGTRLQMQQMVWGMDSTLKIIRIDADPEELNRIHIPEAGFVGDAAAVLDLLLEQLPGSNIVNTARAHQIESLRAEIAASFRRLTPQVEFLDAIRAALPENGIFVDELTQVGYVSRFAFPVYRPRTYLSPGYQGTLGWGLPAGIGARVARPESPVVVVSGDGGFLFNVQELATAVQHGIAVIVVVFNDGAYGNVRRTQVEEFGNRTIASDLRNPDFVRLAESFGASGLRVNTPEELFGALRGAIAAAVPTVIEVPVGVMPDPWPLIRLGRVR